MPVQFAQGAGLESNERRSDILGNGEITRVHNTNFASRRFPRGSHSPHLERVFDRGFHALPSNRRLVLRERERQVRRENVKLLFSYQFRDHFLIEAKVFGQDVPRRVRNSLREKEGAVLREVAFIEHQQELATIWTKSLNGMGKTGRKQ